jgi:hypothetical protein
MLKNPPHHVGLQTSMINITIVGEIIGEGNEWIITIHRRNIKWTTYASVNNF